MTILQRTALMALGLVVGLEVGLHPLSLIGTVAQANEVGLLTAEPGSRINVRTGPAPRFEAQHYGLAGDRVSILDTAFEPCNDNGGCREWHQVRFVSSGAVGWVRGDVVVQGATILSESCHRQLAAERNRLNNVRNGFLSSISIYADATSPHRDRPHVISFRLGGLGQESVLSSSQFMRNMGGRLVQHCGNVAAVQCTSNASGWHDVYGLVNGEVRGFTCVDVGSRDLRWGEYYCGI